MGQRPGSLRLPSPHMLLFAASKRRCPQPCRPGGARRPRPFASPSERVFCGGLAACRCGTESRPSVFERPSEEWGFDFCTVSSGHPPSWATLGGQHEPWEGGAGRGSSSKSAPPPPTSLQLTPPRSNSLWPGGVPFRLRYPGGTFERGAPDRADEVRSRSKRVRPVACIFLAGAASARPAGPSPRRLRLKARRPRLAATGKTGTSDAQRALACQPRARHLGISGARLRLPWRHAGT